MVCRRQDAGGTGDRGAVGPDRSRDLRVGGLELRVPEACVAAGVPERVVVGLPGTHVEVGELMTAVAGGGAVWALMWGLSFVDQAGVGSSSWVPLTSLMNARCTFEAGSSVAVRSST